MKTKAARKAPARKTPKAPAAFSRIKAAPFSPFGKRMPNEFKLVGALLMMLVALYVFQLISTPSFLKSQVKGVTGLVVADTTQDQQATSSEAATTATATSSASTKKQSSQQQSSTQQTTASAVSSGPAIRIIEPAKDSTQSPGFTVKVELSKDAFICYYLTKDDGSVTWDRRMKPCKTEFTLNKEHCDTTGKGTCYVYVEASDQNGNILGRDSAYYSIQ